MAGTDRRLDYLVEPLPYENRLRVTLTFNADADETLVLSLPTWIPGSYLIREFSRYLSEFDLVTPTGDSSSTLQRLDKARWQLDTVEAGTYSVEYSVFAHELTVRTPHVDDTHAFFNGANALLHVAGAGSFYVSFDLPANWEAFVPLPRDGERSFFANSYDRLADTAFECGPHDAVAFAVGDVPHRLVFWGDEDVAVDKERLRDDIVSIVEFHRNQFGSLPYERYDFLFHITPTARGGLEHLSSTTLATPWSYFEDPEKYPDLLTLIAHEHFHAWNGKRIRPRELGPFDYQNENYTRGLWVVEGFTSYFDEYNTFRAGLIDEEAYLERLAKSLDRLEQIPGRGVQSVADASYDAWIRLYRPDEDTLNRTVSYYLKGSLIALLIDLTIRERSQGRHRLDEVMKHLYKRFLKDGRGYDEAEMAGIIDQVTGVDLSREFQQWVYGTEELPLDDALTRFGLTRERESEDADFKIGVRGTHTDNGLEVETVLSSGPNTSANLQPGDRIVAINGRQVKSDNFGMLLKPGDASGAVNAHLFRLGRLREVELAIDERSGTSTLERAEPVDERTKELRKAWLGS
jgi:predicted metalloprotease with PDZ domain